MTSKKERKCGDHKDSCEDLTGVDEKLSAGTQPASGGGETTDATVELKRVQKSFGRTQSDINKVSKTRGVAILQSELKGATVSQPNIKLGRSAEDQPKSLPKTKKANPKSEISDERQGASALTPENLPHLSRLSLFNKGHFPTLGNKMTSDTLSAISSKCGAGSEGQMPSNMSETVIQKAISVVHNMECYLEQIAELTNMNNSDHMSFKCFLRNVQLYEQYIPVKTRQDGCPEVIPLFTVFLYAKVIDNLIVGSAESDFRFVTWDLAKDALMDSVAAILGNATGSVLLTVDNNKPSTNCELNSDVLDKYCDVLSRFFAYVSGVDFDEVRHLFALEENAIFGIQRKLDTVNLCKDDEQQDIQTDVAPSSCNIPKAHGAQDPRRGHSGSVNDDILESLSNRALSSGNILKISDKRSGFQATDIDKDWPSIHRYINENKAIFQDFLSKSPAEAGHVQFTAPWDMIRRLERVACVITNTVLQKESRLVKNRLRVIDFLLQKQQLDGPMKFFDEKYGDPETTMAVLLTTLQQAVEQALDEEMEKFEASERKVHPGDKEAVASDKSEDAVKGQTSQKQREHGNKK